jgi:hypothetical protein
MRRTFSPELGPIEETPPDEGIKSGALATGLLRSLIQKAERGRRDIEADLIIIERQEVGQLRHRGGAEDRAKDNEELSRACRGIADQASLEGQIQEFSREG